MMNKICVIRFYCIENQASFAHVLLRREGFRSSNCNHQASTIKMVILALVTVGV